MSDFGKTVADTLKEIKKEFEGKADIHHGTPQQKPVDKSVREEINSEFDKLIEKNEKR